MTDVKRYQVMSACVIVPVDRGDGAKLETLYRGAAFQSDPDHPRIAYNVESGYIVEIGADAVAGVDAAGAPLVDDVRTSGDGDPGDPVGLTDPGTVNEAAQRTSRAAVDKAAADRQAAADAPPAEVETDTADGKTRRGGRPSAAEKAELVEQAVAAGMDRSEAERASVPDLRAALKG